MNNLAKYKIDSHMKYLRSHVQLVFFLDYVVADLPAPAVKLIVQSLGSTLFRYR